MDEFRKLLVAFDATYRHHYPQELTLAGHARQRHVGGGAKGAWRSSADTRGFILVSQQTNPLQTAHALQLGLRQPQANYWIPPLLPILRATLEAVGMKPERDASRLAHHPRALEGGPNVAIDGRERRRQRPADATKQKTHYSGKQKTHTDTNLLLVNAHTGKVVYRSPTVAGHRHEKKMADEAAIVSPTNATLDKDPGFQG